MPECPDSEPAEAAALSRIFEAAGAQLRQQSQAVGELRAAQLALHDEYGPSHPLALQADAALLHAALDFRDQFDMAEAWWGSPTATVPARTRAGLRVMGGRRCMPWSS